MIRSFIAFAMSVLALSVSTYKSFSADQEFLSDRRNGCKIAGSFDSDVPEPREIEWSGNCVNGFADGYGILIYFSDGQPYWHQDTGEKSGLKLKNGEYTTIFQPDNNKIHIDKCGGTFVNPMVIRVMVPKKLNLIFSSVLQGIVATASQRAERPGAREQMGCLGKKRKELIIYKEHEGISKAIVRLRHQPDMVKYKGFYHFQAGTETWFGETRLHVEWDAALREKSRVINEVMKRQRERLAAQQREEKLARMEAEKRERQRQAEERARIEREEAERRQKELELRLAELQELAEADARERDRTKPADSWCFFSCDPTERNGRLALSNKLDKFLTTPVIVTKFRKTNGVRGSRDGIETYELYFEANVELPQGFMVAKESGIASVIGGANAMGLAMELESLMDYTDLAPKDGKRWTDPRSLFGKGKVFFRKTEQGWEGYDGVIYAE